jgi:choline-sulfatase
MTRPNILFLFSDEHNHRFMGHRPDSSGREPVSTPAFDRLAAQGTVFSDTYCQMALCTPSRMCLLSGREVRGCGAWDNNSVLAPELLTIPKLLADGGYTTCLVGKMHFGGNLQFHGFQYRPYGDLTGRTGHQWEPLGDYADAMVSRTRDAGLTQIPDSKIQDVVVAQETVAFLREQAVAEPETPWFLCASFSRPHFPLTVPPRHLAPYWPDGVTKPAVPAAGDAYDHPMSVGMREGFRVGRIDEDEMMRARAAYFGCVSYLDEVIGDLLLRLEADGLLDNTVIVYASDHGEMAGEHGVWWKQGWYEGCTRVPLIMSTPAQRRGEENAQLVNTPVGLVDLFPTFCSMAGLEMPDGLDGVDLSSAVFGQAEPPDRPIVCDNLNPRWGAGTEFRMVRQGPYKYVRFRDCEPLFFDLENDPGEQRNLIDCAQERVAAARDVMASFADDSMDFDAAERDRVQGEQQLHAQYKLDIETSFGNQYLMPDGRLIEADDTLYDPMVLSDNPAGLFSDWPED